MSCFISSKPKETFKYLFNPFNCFIELFKNGTFSFSYYAVVKFSRAAFYSIVSSS